MPNSSYQRNLFSFVFKFMKQKLCFRFKSLEIISFQIKADAVTQVCIQRGLLIIGKLKTSLTKSLHVTWVGLKSILKKKAKLEPNLRYYSDYTFWVYIICIWTWRNNALPILGVWNEVESGVARGKLEHQTKAGQEQLWCHLQSCFLWRPLNLWGWNFPQALCFYSTHEAMTKQFSGQNFPTELTAKISVQQQGDVWWSMVLCHCSGDPFTDHTSLAGREAVPSGPLASSSMLHFTPFLPPCREFGLLYPYIRDFEYFFSRI